MCLAMEDSEIQSQQNEYEADEAQVEPPVLGKGKQYVHTLNNLSLANTTTVMQARDKKDLLRAARGKRS